MVSAPARALPSPALLPWHLAAGLTLAAVVFMAASLGPSFRHADAPADRIVAVSNSARTWQSLPPLRSDAALTRAAVTYANEMAATAWFDHTGAGGSTLVSRAEAAGYEGWAFLSENLVRAPSGTSPEEVVDAWLSSPEHRRNLLSTEVTETGVGCVSGGSPARIWCVQLFGHR